jgi:branched-chain amino acid transport system permease protein
MLALFVLAVACVPAFAGTYLLKLVTGMVVLAIFAISLDLLVGYTGLVSFGHAAFFGLAGYVLQLLSPEDGATNLLIVLPLALATTAAVAALIGALVVRTSGIYFIMVTLAFAQMLFFYFHDSPIAGGSDGAYIYVKPTLPLGVVTLNLDDRAVLFYFALTSLVVCYLLLAMLLRSPFGQVIQGIKANEHRMRALGYNTYRYKLVSFVIAGVIAGLAGFLFACIDGFVAPQLFDWRQSGVALLVVILGGMGTLFGPVIGAFAYVGMEELFKERAVFGAMADHWQILMGIFVIAVVLFLRNGLGGLLLPPGDAKASDDEDTT